MSDITATPVAGFAIRKAVAEDVSLILRFIRELAEYEQLLDEVKADEAQLARTLFGEHPTAEVLIGEYRNEPAGFALFFHNYSTFLAKPGLYLEDLYIRRELRGLGLGKAMLAHLASIAVARDCGRFEWSGLDWNRQAIDFYRKLGAEPMDEWTVQRVTGHALHKLAEKARVG
ncbi:N-acetyltransferase family protein [Uliginosibacterium sp. sgz301328]|uniref:GNAT family N-acetyltransferase n=1 Tax=Uliginosibacterium sp. sgz301328 TaxID=3243764 RepID=UPI00359D5409